MTLVGEEKRHKTVTREYVVLRHASEGVWEEVSRFRARSAESACRKAGEWMAQQDDRGVDELLVAIVANRWEPLPVKLEIQTRIKVG